MDVLMVCVQLDGEAVFAVFFYTYRHVAVDTKTKRKEQS